MEISPFGAEHLDDAGALLAARHRADRAREPDLPPRLELTTEARALLERISRRPESAGVVATRRGRMVGYLIGYTIVTSPTSRGASFIATRAGFVGYAGHAVDAEDALDVSSALYARLGTSWVEAGCLAHYVQVAPTDAAAEQRWHALGFGRESVTVIRDTEPLGRAVRAGDIRRAAPSDLDTIMMFVDGLHRFLNTAPSWRPYLPGTHLEDRAFQKQMLEDSACAHWIASEDGQPVAMQSLQPPPWYLSQLIVPDRSVYLLHAYTEPAARARGIGTALLGDALAWARERGYQRCLLDFTAASLVSARFWLGHGFRPIANRLCRRLDERLV